MQHFQPPKQDTKRDKILGALWGSVLGDVIGAFLEFDKDVTNQKIKKAFQVPGGGKHNLEPGQPTDDSQLNYAVCKGLLRGNGKLNLNMIAQEMGNWFLSKPIDVGGTIRNSVPKACNMKVHQAHLCRKGAKEKSQKSQSNGTLMALIGMAIWCQNLSSRDLIQAIKEYTVLIHPSEMVVLVNSGYALMVQFYLQNEKQQNERGSFEYMKKCLDDNKGMFDGKNFGEFGNWLNLIEKSFESLEVLEKELPITKVAGWARIAFSYAVHFAVKSCELKKPIEYLISAKGDTDTNACIAGGLIGAKLGLKGIEQMNDQMEKIRKWRPQKKMRPNWMVPGMVIDSIGEFMCAKSPQELVMVGSQKEYEKEGK